MFRPASIAAVHATSFVIAAGVLLAGGAATAGVDVFRSTGFAGLQGKRVALLTNQTGRSRDGMTSIDLLDAAPGVSLVALFSPEHGIRGELDDRVPSSRDGRTGLPVYSLYGETRRPTATMLAGIDAIVVDLQDIGARFYTFPATIAYVMEEAARRRIAVIVLDRPNPLNGRDVEGPLQDSASPGFNGYLRMPIRHGLTIGELARVFNAERRLGAMLTVVAMKNWRRDEWFDDTALPWIDPSPNIRTLDAAILYPGIGAIEGTNISVGRGTPRPFEQVGAPWIDGRALSEVLNARRIPGVRVSPAQFTPERGSRFGGELCSGVALVVADRRILHPVRLGVEIASALSSLYGPAFHLEAALPLLGSSDTIARIQAGENPAAIAASWKADEASWRKRTEHYRLY